MAGHTQQMLLASGNRIGTPASIGTRSVTTGTNTSSITITTSANIVAGDLVVVFFVVDSTTARTVSSVSDGTNTYSLAKAQTATSGAEHFDLEVWYKENAAAVSSGASLTATLSGATDGGYGHGAGAVRIANVAAASSLDKTASDNTNTATPSVVTAALAQAAEIALGFSTQVTATTTYTEASGFTNLFNALATGASGTVSSMAYQIVASTSAVTYAPTWSGAGGLATETIIVTFKGA